MIARFLSMFDLTQDSKLMTFLIVVGLVYSGIGLVSGFVHDWHMDSARKRGENESPDSDFNIILSEKLRA